MTSDILNDCLLIFALGGGTIWYPESDTGGLMTSLRHIYLRVVGRSRFPRRLFLGIFAGTVGVIIIYLIGWAVARDSTSKTGRALRNAYKPGIANLIYAQTMAESLAATDNTAGGPVQTRVLGLAEALKEREDFNEDLASYVTDAVERALHNACLERRIVAVSLEYVTGNPQQAPSCPRITTETDLDKLETERLAAEEQYQGLLSQLAKAHVSAQFEGDPRAETTAAALSREATTEAFKVGQIQLAEALVLVEKDDIVRAIEGTRQYAVSSEGDLNELEQLMSDLEYLIPHSQDWHERHHDEIAHSPLWTNVKVSAGDVARDLAFAKDATGKEYRYLGGVEGSIKLFIEEQRQQKGEGLAQAQQILATKAQHLESAATNAKLLQTLLASASRLISARVDAQTESLEVLLFSVQLWHLTWGVLAGLVGAIIGEYITRLDRLVSLVHASWRGSRSHFAERTHERHHLDVIFPLVGLLFGTLVSIRLGDRLEDLSSLLVTLAISKWYGYLGAIVIVGAVGSFVGGLAGTVLMPRRSGLAIARKDMRVAGGGGVLAGVVVTILLNWLLGPTNLSVASIFGDPSVQAQVLALTLVGGGFGSLIGSRLLAGKGPVVPLASWQDRENHQVEQKKVTED